MYIPIPPQRSCARAWVAAAGAIAHQRDAYNVVIDVDDPTASDAADNQVITLVDSFLREQGQNPVSTVANTIFPEGLYRQHGSPQFYNEYIRFFDGLTETKRWGRYFERMIRHRTAAGEEICPLRELIVKMSAPRRQMYTSAFELAIYDPDRDRRTVRGGQCLSFLSFKIHRERGVTLTALYRNHSYIGLCLGNLIGLSRLQSFVARETGKSVGPLTCISTHAELEVGKWGKRKARELVGAAASILEAAGDAPS